MGILAFALAGCRPAPAATDSGASTDSGTSTGTLAPPDFSVPGPYTVGDPTTSSVTVSCKLTYDLYTPDGVASPPVVLLAHGFMRSRAQMAGWAALWASWGVEVATPDLCHESFSDSDPAQNAADLVALAAHLGSTAPVYAGHSAGGLAAVLAAALDPNAAGVVGLDAVDDNAGDGLAAAPTVSVPAYALLGEPSSCNSDENGAALWAAVPGAQALTVADADHCSFENPTDGLCTALCAADNVTFTDAQVQEVLADLSTGAVLALSGTDLRGAAFWTAGDPSHDGLVDAGRVR